MASQRDALLAYLQSLQYEGGVSQYEGGAFEVEDIKMSILKAEEDASSVPHEDQNGVKAESWYLCIQRGDSLPPILIGEFNLSVIADHLYYTARRSIALDTIARNKGIQIRGAKEKEMDDFQNRPDLQRELAAISLNPVSMSEIHVKAQELANREMSFITPERFVRAISFSIKNLIQQAVEIDEDNHRIEKGLAPRPAKKQKARVVRNAARAASALANVSKGRRQGSKSKKAIFTYKNLCTAIRAVDENDELEKSGKLHLPMQKDVAAHMGYGGADPATQLGNDMSRCGALLKKHGHSTHRWKQVCKDVLSRN